ncbi:Ribokinase [Porphyridium purpureum]|uniref:Ribokinase n=1 Tax=Porphyridium purpureum TaxID=35688 RepID=A0A5J4YS00_PORPP|nr:Ribokinase [Porphyridium purpureum]|eukprot:POR6116..scf236_6
MTVVVVGSVNVDFVANVARFPRRAETITATKNLELSCGGKGANQCVAARRLLSKATDSKSSNGDAVVYFAACVGRDEFAATALRNLKENGVDLGCVHHEEDVRTGCAFILVEEETGENTITVVPGANYAFHPTYVMREPLQRFIEEARVILLQLEIPLETVLATASLATTSAHSTLILNPAPFPTGDEGLPLQLLECVDVLVVNEVEAQSLASTVHTASSASDLPLLAASLTRRLHEFVGREMCLFLTAGSRGVFLCTGDDAFCVIHIAAVDLASAGLTAINSVGAGDTFCGALGAYLQENPLDAASESSLDYFTRAARFASAAAAISVTRHGAQESMPEKAEVEQLLASLPYDKATRI